MAGRWRVTLRRTGWPWRYDTGCSGCSVPSRGSLRGCSPPCPYLVFSLHAADADVVLVRAPRQLLEGGTKPSVGLGRSQETPWCPPPPNTRSLGTHPVVAQLPGTGGLQADAVDVVPGEVEMGVTTLWLRRWRHPQDVPPREACWGGVQDPLLSPCPGKVWVLGWVMSITGAGTAPLS